jgi:pre-mRNA-processing factor 8
VYAVSLFVSVPPQAIELELDEDEDAPVYEWFYDHQALKYTTFVNGPSYRRWKLPLPIMSVLYRLAGQLLSDFVDRCEIQRLLLQQQRCSLCGTC